MTRMVVFGNSGSGKSTFAAEQSAKHGCAHLDLDTVAWIPGTSTPARESYDVSSTAIQAFIQLHQAWVIEGCYADLLVVPLPYITEMVFLNPGPQVCVENARNRPWEPHKYSSRKAQDANLEMLIAWIQDYDQRTDTFSYQAHRQLFDGYSGKKREYRSNDRPV